MASKKPPAEANAEIDAVIAGFGSVPFSSKEFIKAFSEEYPAKWAEIVKQYKIGGKGSGNRFSAAGFMGRQLDFRSDKQKVLKLPRRKAPAGWGNRWISVWQSPNLRMKANIYPDELDGEAEIHEGAKKKVLVNKYERDKSARLKCIKHYGCKCFACNFEFTNKYGEYGANFIHVHHLRPLHKIAKDYIVDPIADLRPVCPNCHAMIHYRGGLLSIEELRAIIRPD
ncbi:HNH endonuclease [Methylobacterium sp. W2]|uniref:HNH endonuclease n=1 Tax=Methylobacterium sp. W2 TaxID=2598107 RepID=UPI001D0CCCB3|nr:HNH endonuclease [Methylobacterium sp. W2]